MDLSNAEAPGGLQGRGRAPGAAAQDEEVEVEGPRRQRGLRVQDLRLEGGGGRWRWREVEPGGGGGGWPHKPKGTISGESAALGPNHRNMAWEFLVFSTTRLSGGSHGLLRFSSGFLLQSRFLHRMQSSGKRLAAQVSRTGSFRRI